MNIFQEAAKKMGNYNSRRYFLKQCIGGVGAMALDSIMDFGQSTTNLKTPHFLPTAKIVIFLHMAGAPSQLELFDYKPILQKYDGKPCPAALLEGKRFAFLQGTPNMMGPQASFQQYGQTGSWVSEHSPHFSKMVDENSQALL